ncbi:proteasome inhibitor 31 kDa [Lasioglossum baleicum]|uniref:proteasome inhibitor 31 kDa n=1 Tax=Lasioglossum baleicum TaxID=434251 RepID=UPI003FCEBE24
MADVNFTFGFELLQSLYDSQISKKEDVLILFVHWYLIKNSFRCIDLGYSKSYDVTEKGSELLPEGWSKEFHYALRYVKDKKLYILHGIKSDEDLLLNLLRTQDQDVSNIQFQINQTVTDLRGPLESLIPTYQSVAEVIQTDLLKLTISEDTASTSTQTSTETREHSPIQIPQGFLLRQPIRVPPGEPSAGNIGDRDLYPLAREGGGMIFDPFNPLRTRVNPGRPGIVIPGRLPPGAVPPNARFDPFGPPEIDQPRLYPRNRDNDDLLPPRFDDHMFM